MSTKSFIISLPIITGDQDRRRLRKSFSFGCNLQNAVMGGGWDRVLKMRATAEWQTARRTSRPKALTSARGPSMAAFNSGVGAREELRSQ